MLLSRRCPGCQIVTHAPCSRCWPARSAPPSTLTVPGVDRVLADCGYDDWVKPLILAAKNHHRRDLLRFLGWQLAQLEPALGLPQPATAVTWVPASAQQRQVRGYDQGQLLARAVGRSLGIPAVRLLKRGPGSKQVGKGRSLRLEGPELTRTRRSVPTTVLLVDDIMTTGGSLASSARTLRGGGACVVGALVVAAKP